MIQSTQNLANRESMTPEIIQKWLVQQLAEQLKLEPDQVDIKTPFESYGLDSSQILVIAGKAEKIFGFKLSPVLLWHYPTIESLSQRLIQEFVVEEQVFEI
jgi:acyl carrier protein